MDLSAMSVGARIRFLREEKRMTQSELADKIGTTPQNIYKYEQGIISNIPINRVMQIAKVFDVSPSLIAGWDEEKEGWCFLNKIVVELLSTICPQITKH